MLVLALFTSDAFADFEAELRSLLGTHDVWLALPDSPRSFRAEIGLAGTKGTLDLEPWSQRGAGFQVFVDLPGNSRVEIDPGPVRILRGSIEEIPGSEVYGVLTAGGLRVEIVLADGSLFRLEPVQTPSRRDRRGHRIRPAGRGVAEPGPRHSPLLSSLATELTPALLKTAGGGGVADCATQGGCVAELIVDTDSGFCLAHAGPGGEIGPLIATVEEAIARQNLKFEELSIFHQIQHLEIRCDPATDPYAPPCCAGGGEILGKIQSEWSASSIASDLILLLLERPFLPANASSHDSICEPGRSYVTQIVGCQIAHEWGHVWGVFHPSQGLMQNGASACSLPWGPAAPLIETRRDQVAGVCLDLLENPNLVVSLDGNPLANGAAIPFGTTLTGAPTDRTLEVSNSGNAELVLSALTTTTGFSLVGALPPPIAPGENDGFVMRLDAASSGIFSGVLMLTTNDPENPQFALDLDGVALDPNSLDPVYVDFSFVGQELGTETHPLSRFALAVEVVVSGGDVILAPGVSPETLVIDRAMKLTAPDGPVILGDSP